MKKVLMLLFLMFSFIVLAGESNWIEAELYDVSGNYTKISRINKNGFIRGYYNGKQVVINFDKIKQIDRIDLKTWSVINKIDKVFELIGVDYIQTNNDKYGKYFDFYFFDDITLEEKYMKKHAFCSNKKENTQVNSYVQTISFGGSINLRKQNLRTKSFYPSHYDFDPFTGEKLYWEDSQLYQTEKKN